MFQLGFTTTDYNRGQSILVIDNSSDWNTAPGNIQSVTFIIESLYYGVIVPGIASSITIPISTVDFSEHFQYEITAEQLGFSKGDTIPDSIYNIKMSINDQDGPIGGDANTYISDEVVYYNAMFLRDNFIATKASYLDAIYNKDMDYANWVDFLVTSIEANANSGNSSAIYYNFDIIDRLNQ